MDVLHTCCCGLDVHKETVVACLIHPAAQGQRQKEIRTFGTTTAALRELADWLRAAGCTHIALESTGVYRNRHEGCAHTAQDESRVC